MLDISPIVMLIETGIFLVTLILLNQWLFQPLLSFMEKRDLKLEEELKSVSSNANEAKQYEEEIASIISEAKTQAAHIKKEAAVLAKKEAIAMVESEVSKVEEAKRAFNDELEARKAELTQTLEANSDELREMLSAKLKGIA